MKHRNLMLVAAALAVGGFGLSAYAEDFSTNVSSFWAESNYNTAGNYVSPDINATVSGGVLSAPIPTDANSTAPDYDVVNYIRTRSDLAGASPYYNGSLLGNLSGKTTISATFSLNNDQLASGAQFQTSDFVGEGTNPIGTYTYGDDKGSDINGGTPTPSLRLSFYGSTPETANGDGTPNIWWSTAGVDATSMDNGTEVTLTVSFDPADWSNYDGKNGAASSAFTTDFENALSSVQDLGLSFGSGYFYSDGFAFNTGGTASLNLDSISTSGSVVPLPASAWSGLALLGGLGLFGAIKRHRKQMA